MYTGRTNLRLAKDPVRGDDGWIQVGLFWKQRRPVTYWFDNNKRAFVWMPRNVVEDLARRAPEFRSSGGGFVNRPRLIERASTSP